MSVVGRARLVVGSGVLVVTLAFTRVRAEAPALDPGVRVLRRRAAGHAGLIAGLWAEKFDQLAAFQNFIIMPMTFLSGVFYSIRSLPTSGRRSAISTRSST